MRTLNVPEDSYLVMASKESGLELSGFFLTSVLLLDTTTPSNEQFHREAIHVLISLDITGQKI